MQPDNPETFYSVPKDTGYLACWWISINVDRVKKIGKKKKRTCDFFQGNFFGDLSIFS